CILLRGAAAGGAAFSARTGTRSQYRRGDAVLPETFTMDEKYAALRALVNNFFLRHQIGRFTAWYFTPMPWPYTEQLNPDVVIYDCMDELANFKSPPATLRENEMLLMKRADAVFTGGYSLYEAKRERHHNIHPMPSSVDYEHFARA